jgi:NADPH-dependent glutamate synthase beta subunit-like oxidoreductase
MKLAIMQPYFLPYIGYFQLIATVDRFIVYDNIKYTKKGWINRNRFLQNGKDATFSLPLKKDSDSLDICERELAADFVFLAMGFVGPEKGSWLDQLGVSFDDRGNVARDARFMTNVPGVFVAGDMGRGQSLIVWAIAEGRACAAGVDEWLMGSSALPAPITPTARPLI